MMGTEIFKIDASWAEKLTKTRVQFLLTPSVIPHRNCIHLVCCGKVLEGGGPEHLAAQVTQLVGEEIFGKQEPAPVPDVIRFLWD